MIDHLEGSVRPLRNARISTDVAVPNTKLIRGTVVSSRTAQRFESALAAGRLGRPGQGDGTEFVRQQLRLRADANAPSRRCHQGQQGCAPPGSGGKVPSCRAQRFAHIPRENWLLAREFKLIPLSLSIYSTIAKAAPAWHLRGGKGGFLAMYTRASEKLLQPRSARGSCQHVPPNGMSGSRQFFCETLT